MELLPGLVDAVAPGGWLAFQVPGNFGAPSHTILTELRGSPRWRDRLGHDPQRGGVHEPAEYLDRLADSAARSTGGRRRTCTCDGRGSGAGVGQGSSALRPVLDALQGAEREIPRRVRDRVARPPTGRAYGTVFPVPRIFRGGPEGQARASRLRPWPLPPLALRRRLRRRTCWPAWSPARAPAGRRAARRLVRRSATRPRRLAQAGVGLAVGDVGPEAAVLTTIGLSVAGSMPSSRNGAAAAARPPRCLGWASSPSLIEVTVNSSSRT